MTIPVGLCQCGCGRRTRIPTKNDRPKGQIAGVPLRYINGHWLRTRTIARARIEDRFWPKVERRGEDDCWEWQGRIHRTGYGQFWDGTMKSAHRIAYTLAVGAIPQGLHVLHSCDNKRCVNPAHLRVGTNAENAREAWERGQQPQRVGEALPWTRFTVRDVREIRRLHQEGVPTREIARRFGMSKTNARDIATGRTWKHVA